MFQSTFITRVRSNLICYYIDYFRDFRIQNCILTCIIYYNILVCYMRECCLTQLANTQVMHTRLGFQRLLPMYLCFGPCLRDLKKWSWFYRLKCALGYVVRIWWNWGVFDFIVRAILLVLLRTGTAPIFQLRYIWQRNGYLSPVLLIVLAALGD